MEEEYRPRKAERMIAREEDESLLLFDSDSGSVKVLNETAALVWNSIDGKTPVKDLIDTVVKAFPDSERQMVVTDVLAFLKDLREHTFIE
jgi:hypothetical protein